jgi:hypothetical protein
MVNRLAEQGKYPEISKLLTSEIDAKMERELKKQMESALQKTPATCDDVLRKQQNIIRELNQRLRFIGRDLDASRDT